MPVPIIVLDKLKIEENTVPPLLLLLLLRTLFDITGCIGASIFFFLKKYIVLNII